MNDFDLVVVAALALAALLWALTFICLINLADAVEEDEESNA